MTFPNTARLSPSIRKAAVFLLSLEEGLAEHMLREMPEADAQAVRTAMLQLEDCDAVEQQEVMADFRRNQQAASQPVDSGVELDASLLAHIEQQTDTLPEVTEHDPLAQISDQEAATIAETLSREHPQTVALVISRLQHQTAASILPRLSANLQDEVLCRLAELDPADQSSVAVVESQLVAWVNEHRRKEERLAHGSELVQKLLQNTSASDRHVIVGRISRDNPRMAQIFGTGTEPAPPTVSSSEPSFAQPSSGSPSPPPRRKILKPAVPQVAIDTDAFGETNPLSELEELDDATLMAVLSEADRNVVTIALAGASESLLKRVLKRLPKSQAKKYRSQFRNIGPTRLSDMLAAQQQLAHFAQGMKGTV